MKRRTHSSLDKLPAALRDTITRMIIDNEWPVDFPKTYDGTPRLEDIVEYCKHRGQWVSKSAVGRYSMGLKTIEKMRTLGLIARKTMENLTPEDAPRTQKAAAQMATALILEFMTSRDDYTSKQIKEVSQAIRDTTQVTINADKYIREQIATKVKAAEKNITDIAKKKKIDPETLRIIREQIYGIYK